MTEPHPAPETPTVDPTADPTGPSRPHGDPLLDSAQGRGDGDDASRHGRPQQEADGGDR